MDKPTGYATIGMLIAISKKMAIRYGVANINDIRLNSASNGIDFVLTDGTSITVPFDASELPFRGGNIFLNSNNVQDAIYELSNKDIFMMTGQEMSNSINTLNVKNEQIVICKKEELGYKLGNIYKFNKVEGGISTWEEISLNKRAVEDALHDKLGIIRYATELGELVQSDALEILNNYGNYEGQIIEFLTNGELPNKTFAWGYVVSDKNGNQFLRVENTNGTITLWDKVNYKIIGKLPYVKGYNVLSSSWIDNEDENYKAKTTIQLLDSPKSNDMIELINDNLLLFTKYGFGINSIVGNDVTIFALEKPTEDIILKIQITSIEEGV